MNSHTPLLSSTIGQAITPHSPIIISTNNHFAIQGFLGTGTVDNPYLIEHLNITASSGDLIRISDTSVYFRISGNFLNGLTTASSGISLTNVQNAFIENNTVSNSRFGVFLLNTSNCTLSANLVHDNQLNGVHLKEASNTTIFNNTIYNHNYGAYPYSSILLDNSSHTFITHNSLFNSHNGINLLRSANTNLIINNTIYDNLQYGIRIEYASKNTITHNILLDNQLYGILLTFGANNNTVSFNNFTRNNAGGHQGTDDGTMNVFTYNHWDDWPILDVNNDFIIDTPYPIDGTVNNSDPYPLVSVEAYLLNNNQGSGLGNDLILLFVFFIALMSVASLSLGYVLYKRKFKRQEAFSESEGQIPFEEVFPSDQIESLKPLYHKLIVGLENIQTASLPEPVTVTLLEPAESVELVEYFPSDIKDDLISGLKGRTILTLIEIAYQDPSETNLVKLAKSLDIPVSTLSKEIKRLNELKYVESFASSKVLHDARFKNYIITPKGFKFLFILKEALRITITRLKETKGDIYT
ncbi:MAG: right-handed parallel beta-helix repeat-containing protein [Candidatus Hodarchaeales archaeon]|jgi:parallel beta-helix repeat protein